MSMGSSSILTLGRGGRRGSDKRARNSRVARLRGLGLEGLESRTLLATTPAAAPIASLANLSGLGSVSSNGNANSPAVAVDPYNSQHLVAVWGVDLSTLTPVPVTTAVVKGAYSTDGGNSWHATGSVSSPLPDPLTVNAKPQTNYTQVTDPSVAFDSVGDVYVLTLQTSAAPPTVPSSCRASTLPRRAVSLSKSFTSG